MNASDLPDETLFERALSCRTPEERAAYLDRACAGQPELRRRLEELLAAHAVSGEFLEPAVAVRPTIKLDLAPEETAGTIIGRYKLLQKIGEGGMGVVYMAEQTEPVIRKVALKIIKLGMDTKAVVARFEAERQALALMDHPNIAKVLDAGATDLRSEVREQKLAGRAAAGLTSDFRPPTSGSGRPYFVMELVHGVPITEYCDKNRLSTQQRLELFIPVCQAIQHAHQKGIIHRDIKPSNVMVTLHDGVPVPKVIDFGVAKATNQRLTQKTLFTNYAQMIGTPAYMSPEQAEMSGLDIDTRSDIYSLGVLLYELLTGSTPFDAKELLSKGYAEMQRIIVEQEPVKPSTRMSTLTDEQRTIVTTHRNTDATALCKVLQGDLDWIVMKCLEKDRTRRYETSNGLATDLRRHLNNELITARPPTTGYLLKKLIKRNKLAFAAASAVAAALFVGFSVATWQYYQQKVATTRAIAAERAQQSLREQAEMQAYASDLAYASSTIGIGNSLGNTDALLSRWQNHQPDFRGWEWYYLHGICHQERLTIVAGTNAVRSVAWHPDGHRLASAGDDGSVRIWDAANGRQIKLLTAATRNLYQVAWSPDGKKLACAGGNSTALIWNVETGDETVVLRGHTGTVYSVAWSPDGRTLLSGGDDKIIRFWDPNLGVNTRTCPADQKIFALAWGPDGNRFASGGSSSYAQIWNAGDAAEIRRIDLHQIVGISSMAWSPTSQWLAVSFNLRVYDVNNGDTVLSLDDHSAQVYCVSWSPDGNYLASASRGDGEIRIRDSRAGKLVQSFRGHLGAVHSLSWSPDSKQVASSGSDGTIRFWKVSETERSRVMFRGPGQTYSLAWHPDGRHLAQGSTQGPIWIWDTTRQAEPFKVLANTSWVFRVAWNPQGTLLASGCNDGSVQIWEWPSGKQSLSFQAHDRDVRGLAWSPDGKRLATLTYRGLKIWDPQSGLLLSTIPGAYGTALAWRKDGLRLAAGEVVFDPNSGEEVARFTSHHEGIRELAWSPDGRQLASASDDNTLKLLDLTTGRELRTFVGHGTQVYGVSWSPDGSRLASADWEGWIKIWNPKTGQLVASFSRNRAALLSLEWSPDGQQIAVGSISGEITLHDATPGIELERKRTRTR